MTDDEVTGQSDETQESGPSTTNEPAPSEPATEDKEVQETESQEQENLPFHKHPRFKELIEQNNNYKTRLSEFEKQMQDTAQNYQRQLEQMQSQLKPKEPVYDPKKFFEKARSIDPEFAQTLEWQAQQAQQLQQRLDTMNQERLRESAYSKLNNLFETNKVDPKLRPMYESAIKMAAYENPRISINDLDKLFSQTHENYSKFLEGVKRTERESYVKQKKSDVTPTSQTGGGVPPTGKGPDLSTYDKRVAYLAAELRRNRQKI